MNSPWIISEKNSDEIMSMNVEPSTRTNLLEVSFDYELNMTDSKGNYVEDTWSVSSDQYYEQLGSSDNTSSDDTGEGSGDNSDGGSDSYDNGSGIPLKERKMMAMMTVPEITTPAMKMRKLKRI